MKRYVIKIKALLIGAAVLSLFAASPSFSTSSNPFTRLKESIKNSKAVKQEVKAAKAGLKQAEHTEKAAEAHQATLETMGKHAKGETKRVVATRLSAAKISVEDAREASTHALGRLNDAKAARDKTLGGSVSNTAKVVKAKVQSAANRVATPFKRK